MYNIKTMNKIAPVGLERLPAERYLTGDGVENEDAILVRSAKLHDYVFPEKLGPIPAACCPPSRRAAWTPAPCPPSSWAAGRRC